MDNDAVCSVCKSEPEFPNYLNDMNCDHPLCSTCLSNKIKEFNPLEIKMSHICEVCLEITELKPF